MNVVADKHSGEIGYKHSEESKRKMRENHPRYWSGKSQSTQSNEKRSQTLRGEGCYWFGKTISDESKSKISAAHLGRKRSLETRRKISQTLSGIGKPPVSDETKEKRRILRLQQIEDKYGGTNFNRKACHFIDTINEVCGSQFQHALNGKEKWIAGYAVDGYDSDKNVVVEYDEKHHYTVDGHLKSRDQTRQQRIINKIAPSLFLRYNEPQSKLYDAITGNTWTLDQLKHYYTINSNETR